MSLLQKTVIPFAWNTVAISFNQGTPASVNLASFLRNDQGYTITFGVLGSLPTGVTHAAGVLTYNGQGSPASVQATFTASSGSFVATSGSSSVAIADVNLGPYWSNAPATLSGNVGAQVAFGQYANDPDGDVLTFSIVAHPGGYTINASTGAVTLGSSSGPVTLRATDPAGLYADHVCQVTVAASAYKWHPGHYISTDASLKADKVAQINSFLGRIANISLANCPGFSINVPWGVIEPGAKGVFDWTLLDNCIDRACGTLANPNGRKFDLGIWWQQFVNNTTQPPLPTLPQDTATWGHFIPDYIVAAGYAYNSASTLTFKRWLAPAMDHFIDAMRAVALRYDNDPRVSMVSVEEGAGWVPLDGSISSSAMNSGIYTQDLRMLNACRGFFTRTPFLYLNNFAGGEANNQLTTQRMVDIGIGVSAPDTRIEPRDGYGRPQNNYHYLRGDRWNGSAWDIDVAADIRPDVFSAVEKQTNRAADWTPQIVYAETLIQYNPNVIVWHCQNPALVAGSGGVPAPGIDEADIIAWLNLGGHPLRTNKQGAAS